MWSEEDLKHFRRQKNIFLGYKKSIWGPKRQISESFKLDLAIWSLSRLRDSFYGPFFWFISWEMWSEADLKYFRRQKNIFWGSRKSIWGPKRPISESYELNLAIWAPNSIFFWCLKCFKSASGHISHDIDQKNGPSSGSQSLNRPQMAYFSS